MKVEMTNEKGEEVKVGNGEGKQRGGRKWQDIWLVMITLN